MSPLNYAHPEVVVETEWVAEHLRDPKVRLVEADMDIASKNSAFLCDRLTPSAVLIASPVSLASPS